MSSAMNVNVPLKVKLSAQMSQEEKAQARHIAVVHEIWLLHEISQRKI
jgi:hypothetical protein